MRDIKQLEIDDFTFIIFFHWTLYEGRREGDVNRMMLPVTPALLSTDLLSATPDRWLALYSL